MYPGLPYQIAYVTRDITAAVADFRRRVDVRHESVWEGEQPVRVADGGTRIMHNKLALLWVGNMQYEIIEPVPGGLDEIYRPALPAGGGMAFHHIAARVADWSAFREAVARQDMPIAFEGQAGDIRFLYLDAREACGHYLEYTHMPDAVWTGIGGL